MNNELESIVLLLQNINSQLTSPVFNKNIITKELENIVDAQENSTDINLLLHELLSINVKDADDMVKALIFLHLKLSRAIWHTEQVHEMVKDLIAKYRDSI
jgi:hypothetical protein